MKFKVTRRGIEIRPETEQDEAYIADTLGLKRHGDVIELVRMNDGPSGMALVELTTTPFPDPRPPPKPKKEVGE